MHVAKGLRSGLWSGEGNTGEGGAEHNFLLNKLLCFCGSRGGWCSYAIFILEKKKALGSNQVTKAGMGHGAGDGNNPGCPVKSRSP